MKKFLFLLIFALTALLLGAGETYNFFMVSDTHWGAPESYSTDPKVKTKKDIYRAEKAAPHYHTLFADIAKKSDGATRFLIHAGDMIEGRAKNEATHFNELEKSWALMTRYVKLPIYLVKGNHDASGPGGKEAFARFIQAKYPAAASRTNYTVTCGKDLFIFVEYHGALKFVRRTLAGLKTPPRYIFLVIHNDIVPFNAKSTKALCALAAKHNMIVLHGHTHVTRQLDFAPTTGGRLTTFSVGTFLNPDAALMRYKKTVTDPAHFFARYLKKRCKTPEMKNMVNMDCVPYVSNFAEFSSGQKMHGYARITVSDSGVTVSIQSADLTQKPVETRLR